MWSKLGRRRSRETKSRKGLIGGSAGSALVAVLLVMASNAGATLTTHTYVAPYKGGYLPNSNLNTYSCNASAKLVHPWKFNFKTGIGVGALSTKSRACPQAQFRLGSQSSASASGGEEISLPVRIPGGHNGIHNVTVNTTLRFSGYVTESNGSATGACPSTPFQSISGSYYDGSSWSYWPNFKGPIVYNSSTYFYYYNSGGASGYCSAYSSLYFNLVGVIIAQNGLAGYALTPTVLSVGGSVATYASVYWSCYNYTNWQYGTWANSSGSCSNSNVSAYTTSYNYGTGTSGTNTSYTFGGTIALLQWGNLNYSVDRIWDVFVIVGGSLYSGTGGFQHGAAFARLDVASLGNGITINSISVT